ncbi:MAG TPA: 4-hydroxy-tetrahydrodipicolinate reductase [Thermoguttaceae bacterium]|nr:4-hydroxy-tetrahydrodipicolinate reductase [Thermoguttaceae bacterium]
MNPVRIAIHGAAGRMGQRLIALAADDGQLELVAALELPGHPRLGEDAGQIAGVGSLGVSLADSFAAPIDVMIDFSLPEGAVAIAATCRKRNIPLVVATTGLEPAQAEAVKAAAADIPLLWAPSMSLAVNLTMKLAAVAAGALKDQDADVEILERHHRFKADAPSGTALAFGRVIAERMGQTGARHGREGRIGARPHGEIAYHAIRTGDNAGEHTIVFGMLGETIELTVRASNRDCYAKGALAAAKFLVGRPAGAYTMADVLGL